MQGAISLQSGDHCIGEHLDVRRSSDAMNEIVGNVCLQAIAAHDDGHFRSIAGEVQGGLRRGVAGAHQDYVLVAAERSLACPGTVIDAGSKQPLLIRQVQPPIFDAGRAHWRRAMIFVPSSR